MHDLGRNGPRESLSRLLNPDNYRQSIELILNCRCKICGGPLFRGTKGIAKLLEYHDTIEGTKECIQKMQSYEFITGEHW